MKSNFIYNKLGVYYLLLENCNLTYGTYLMYLLK